MGLISHRKRFIYIKTVKTASSTVQNYFLPWCMPESMELHDLKTNFEMVSNAGIVGKINQPKCQQYYFHQSAKEVRKLIGQKSWNNYFKFCTIRNPFDQLVSLYHFGKARKQFSEDTPFPYFVRWITPRLSSRHRSNWNLFTIRNRPALDFYIRYEKLETDLKLVCRELSIPFDPSKIGNYLGHIRPKNDDYRAYYDEKLKSFVRKRWGKIIREFDYEF